MRGRLVAFDVGTGCIGVAHGDAFARMAFPLDTLTGRPGAQEVLAYLRRYEQEYGQIIRVIIGEPPEGKPPLLALIDSIQRGLAHGGYSTVKVDEHVTTQEAMNRLADLEEMTGRPQPGRRDSVAAQILLERYFALHGQENTHGPG